MGRQQEIVLKAILKTLDSEKSDRLLSFLPDQEKDFLLHLPDIHLTAQAAAVPTLDQIHWSWFIPVFEASAPKDQKVLLKVFPVSAQKSLSKVLQITPATEKMSRMALSYLRQTLLQAVMPQNLLPIGLLPPSPLNLILQIEKKKLTKLIDYLSLYDLSRELRQIVETKILQKIYSFLTDDEKQFLKIAATQKEPYTTAQIHLEKWDGAKESFRLTLHRVGLARLGSALSGQDPDLIWYICHQLDSGRGKALEKLCKKEPIPGVAEWLAEQMKELL
ncbi:MAG TPA: hypothetical protein VLE96_05890 [Chlamydiales bacterium]|nr:hypothetical protein [Chlamydiales bacterium]